MEDFRAAMEFENDLWDFDECDITHKELLSLYPEFWSFLF